MCINNGILSYDDVYGGRLLIGRVQQTSDSTTKLIWESPSMTVNPRFNHLIQLGWFQKLSLVVQVKTNKWLTSLSSGHQISSSGISMH